MSPASAGGAGRSSVIAGAGGVPDRADRAASLRAPVAWRDRRLWVVQGVVLALAAARWIVEIEVTRAHAPIPGLPDFSTLGLFLWPVLYAAVTLGATGGVVTTAVVAALSVPRDLLFLQGGDPVAVWAESTQIAALCLVAVVVGQRVAAERAASARAEAARRAHLAAEVRYRALFDASESPTVLVTGQGVVLEANAAAAALVGRPPRTLADLVGADTAARLLQASDRGDRSGVDPPAADRPVGGRPAVVVGDGAGSRHFRVAVADVSGIAEGSAARRPVPGGAPYPAPAPAGDGLLQVVLTDVTAEAQRRQHAEAFADAVLAAQEDERRRLAQELHDGPVQSLVHLVRQLDGLAGPPTGPAPAAPDGAGAAPAAAGLSPRELALAVVHELRRISRGLRPSVLDDLGLPDALRRLAADATERHGPTVALEVTGPVRRLPADVELTVYRVAQEALANAGQHAGATTVRLVLSFERQRVRLLVSDDGHGIDEPAWQVRRADGSLGLSGMAERLRLVGGQVAVRTSDGVGTAIEAVVPCLAADERRSVPAGGGTPPPRSHRIARP